MNGATSKGKAAGIPKIIIDFDSTFAKVESPGELAAIALRENPRRDEIVREVNAITDSAMEGRMSIADALEKRIHLMGANKKHLVDLIKSLKKNISSSFVRNKRFIKKNARNIYIVSNGYKEFIAPVVKSYGIAETHVLANSFKFDTSGNIVGLDRDNPLSKDKGKIEAVKRLGLTGEVYAIGDGITDYELKKGGVVSKFFAFTENVSRDVVVREADHVVSSFDEFLYVSGLPGATSFPKSRLKALLLENIHEDAVTILKREGYEIETLAKSVGEDELAKKVTDVSVLGIRSKTEITPKILASGKRLLAIGAFCVGTNQIDLEEASKKGVGVFNAPYSNTRSVVELVLGDIIMLMRRAFDKSAKLHKGEWDKSAKGSYEVRGKKLGIIGYGNIGTQLSVAGEALGMDVCFFDIVDRLAIGNAVKCATMEEVLKKSDVVSIHVDGNAKNKNLIGEKEIKHMKDGAYLINLSRGSVIDIAALAGALQKGKLSGAAVDVFPYEPKGNEEPFTSELQGLENVILTPHIGGSTEEAQENIGHFVAQKLVDFVNAGNTYLSVNLPNLQLPELKNAHRLIHIHHNMPGVLATINGVLAANKMNILGQYLKTNETIGYVITDVGTKYDSAVIDEMKKVPHTIKFRVLY